MNLVLIFIYLTVSQELVTPLHTPYTAIHLLIPDGTNTYFYLSMNLTKPVTGFHLYIYFSIFLSYIQSIYLCTWILSIGYSPCTAGSPEPEPCLTWRRSLHNYLSICLSSI